MALYVSLGRTKMLTKIPIYTRHNHKAIQLQTVIFWWFNYLWCTTWTLSLRASWGGSEFFLVHLTWNCPNVLPSIFKACRPNIPSVGRFLWCGCGRSLKGFHLVARSTQATPPHHAFNSAWGERCHTHARTTCLPIIFWAPRQVCRP